MVEFSIGCVGCSRVYSEECIDGELTSYQFQVFVYSQSGDDAREISQKIGLAGVKDYNLNFTVSTIGLIVGAGFENNVTITETPGPMPQNETITLEIKAPEETCPLFAYESIEEGCEEVVVTNITLVADEYRPWDAQFVAPSVGGVRIPEIIGGVSVSFERYPYMMSLQVPTFPQGCFDAFCGATLIAPNLLLTAAHCLQYGGGAALTGEPVIEIYAVKSPRCRHEGNNETRSLVTYQHVHPNFQTLQSDGSFSFDVAILQIEDNFSAPYINIDASKKYEIKNNQLLSVIGYGAIADPNADPLGEGGIYVKTKLQKGEVIYQNTTQCKNLVEEVYQSPAENITPEKLCADTYEPIIVDTCVGDSGGPIFAEFNEPTKDIQLGITSYGFPYFNAELGVTFDCAGTTIYTKVSEVLSWIYETVPEVVPLQKNLTRIFIEPMVT